MFRRTRRFAQRVTWLAFLLLSGQLIWVPSLFGQANPAWPTITRKLPPPGIDVSADKLQPYADRLLAARRAAASPSSRTWGDVECLLKAVDLAIDLGEFYKPEHVDRLETVLALAEWRIAAMKDQAAGDDGKTDKATLPWERQRGLVVRGFRSDIDGSAQPYGLEIPESLDFGKPSALYVWLHGRGDRTTDLHFIVERLNKKGQIQLDDAIVLHPFGRQCIGYKSAGETDVLEAVAHVQANYSIDPDRIVLMGFSMGGAGVWHLAAHFADRWVAASPGAGFAETAKYIRLKAEDFPPAYEQRLWGVYDAPCYARNLFNLPVVAYSGEKDKQIQAARVMEDAYAQYGRTLPHLIGPGMGHKYHPDTLNEILARMNDARMQGRNQYPHKVYLQTRSLRYAEQFWVKALRLNRHWTDSRIDATWAEANGETHIDLQTKNVDAFQIDLPIRSVAKVVVDGQSIDVRQRSPAPIILVRDASDWKMGRVETLQRELSKRPGMQGPIDDLFTRPFLVVLPTGEMWNPPLQKWVDFELDHLRSRWRALFRGDLRVKLDSEVSAADMAAYDLLLWGDPGSNLKIAELLDRLPLDWSPGKIVIQGQEFSSASHMPALIYPNPLSPDRYVVLNSGPTFREGHDRTNSLQNPKLPDWAIFDTRIRPDAFQAGRVVAADFFDEGWR